MSQCQELERQILDTQAKIREIPFHYVWSEEARRDEDRRKMLEDRLESLRQRLSRARIRGGC